MEFSSQSQAASASQLPLAQAVSQSVSWKKKKELIMSLAWCRHCTDTDCFKLLFGVFGLMGLFFLQLGAAARRRLWHLSLLP